MVLLSTAFCPPVEYFALLAGETDVELEACESYSKQSWRNRCRILSENGPLELIVPVVHGGWDRITDVRVEYSTPWVPKMEKAISSAYDSSPFFEFYRDEFFAILDSEPERLWDLDLQIIRWLCRKAGIAAEIRFTSGYASAGASSRPDIRDMRGTIHPKRSNTILADLGLGKPYWQVFNQKFGFTPGLSMLDLLFNEGPDSMLWLK